MLRKAGIETVDVMPVMLEARAVKTKEETNCLKMAVLIAETGWYALYEALKLGVRDRDPVAVANDALFRAGAESVWGIIVSSGCPDMGTTK